MIDFFAIPDNSSLGQLLRAPLRLVPKGIEVPILQGPIRGRRWIVGSATHGCWLGTYEASKARRLASVIEPGMTCFDINANVGYYTLLFSHLAGPAGRVIAFEPLPQNVGYLRRHVRINRCNNVEILDLAVADYNGMARFAESERASMGRLSPSGGLSVRCATLESILSEGTISTPDVMKIDVEGAELAVLMGGRKILETAKPIIFSPHMGQRCTLRAAVFFAISAIAWSLWRKVLLRPQVNFSRLHQKPRE